MRRFFFFFLCSALVPKRDQRFTLDGLISFPQRAGFRKEYFFFQGSPTRGETMTSASKKRGFDYVSFAQLSRQ
jgi:hypothetical protein